MNEAKVSTCALLADRHSIFADGVRDMLMSAFDTVYVVADDQSLNEGARRLLPTAIVVDLTFAGEHSLALLRQLRKLSASTRLITLTMHDQPAAAESALQAGAHAVVLKRCIASDLLQAVDAVEQGERFVSPDIGQPST